MGKDEDKTTHELYVNFQDDIEVQVDILALVIVPGKIITGICFPDHPVSNRCPHVTLMIQQDVKPAISNILLEEACTRGTKSPFMGVYEELKETRRVK